MSEKLLWRESRRSWTTAWRQRERTKHFDVHMLTSVSLPALPTLFLPSSLISLVFLHIVALPCTLALSFFSSLRLGQMDGSQIEQYTTPGELLGRASDFVAGAGTYTWHSNVLASVVGLQHIVPPSPDAEDQRPTMEVRREREQGAVPESGLLVTAKITKVQPKLAVADILCVGTRAVREKFRGIVRQQDVRSTEIDKVDVHTSFRPGDIIRAEVLSLGDARAYYLSTAKNELGVVSATSDAGAAMVPVSWQEMQCPVTLQKEFRKQLTEVRAADTEMHSPDFSLDEHSRAARAYYSQDFEWETLRDDIERMHKSLHLLGLSDPGRDGPPELINEKKKKKRKKNIIARSSKSSEGARGQSNELEIKEDGPVTSTAWEAFHVRHSRNIFFKERRYLTNEFPELRVADKSLTVLEIGCGTGSSVVPILKANENAVVFACDCSVAALKKAIEVVSTLGEPSRSSFHPFICDISLETLPLSLCCRSGQELCWYSRSNFGEAPANLTLQGQNEAFDPTVSETTDGGAETVAMMSRHKDLSSEFRLKLPRVCCCAGGLDIVTMIFTLSAVPIEKMTHVLLECLAVLKPGGLLLFRDYGLYDMTMLRFAPSRQISDRLYQRGDGTLSYFFSLEVVRELFINTGFVEQELEYCCVQLTNQQKQVCMKRVWVHAKFQKPHAY